MSDPRRNLFKAGAKYTVKMAIPRWPGSVFDAGEIVTFEAYTYSRYDTASVFQFRDAQGKLKEWWLGDDQAVELSAQFFDANDPEPDIFAPGQLYVSLRTFSRLGSHFRIGERLVFRRVTFSHYDEGEDKKMTWGGQ